MNKSISILLVVSLFTLFSCDDEDQVYPQVETLDITPISASSFSVAGNIIATGNALVLEYGFAYSLAPVPDIYQGTKVTVGSTAVTGIFEKAIALEAPSPSGGYTVFVRAFLTNQKGTVYGAVKEFAVPVLAAQSVAPLKGKTGSQITITGANFSTNAGENEVKFNNITAEIVSTTATTLVVKVPSGVLYPEYSESNTISVTTGGQTAIATENFKVIPTVTDFSPKNGSFGTNITLSGSDFYPFLTSVRIGGIVVAASQVTDESVKFNVPPEVTSDKLKIQLLSGTEVIDVTGEFTITPPVITSITPLIGIGGTVVTITGTGFNIGDFVFSYNTVKFGTVEAEIFNFTATEIIAYVPKGLNIGSYPISLFTGIHTVTFGTQFTVVKPVITGFNPASGIPGTYVTISGTNFGAFDPQNTVLFGTDLVDIYSWNETTITIYIPIGTAPGSVKITVNASGQSVTSAGNYTIL